MHYEIVSKTHPWWAGVETVPYDQIARRINELSGRTIAGYVLSQLGKPHPHGGTPREQVYVATAKGSEGRAIHGKGFIVKRVRD